MTAPTPTENAPKQTLGPIQRSVAALLTVCAVLLLIEAFDLGYMSPLGPGAGFFLLWAAVIIGVTSATLVAWPAGKDLEPVDEEYWPERIGAVRIVGAVLIVACAAMALEWLGYRITMLIFFAAMFVLFGTRHPIVAILVTLGGSFGVYEVFTRYLFTPLPLSSFGFF